jgi:hypothetical protein
MYLGSDPELMKKESQRSLGWVFFLHARKKVYISLIPKYN